jgi:hypothetical protein
VIVVVSTIILGASDAFGVRLRYAKTMWRYGRRDPCDQAAHRRTSAMVRILMRQAVRKLREATRPHHRSFYTDLTRARDEAVVVTDAAAQLAQRVRLDQVKVAALEVAESAERALPAISASDKRPSPQPRSWPSQIVLKTKA